MKLKRLFLSTAFVGLSILGLSSCGDKSAAVEVVGEDGKVTKAKITATEDAEEVTEAVETLLNTKVDEEAIKNIKGLTVSADASLSGDITVLTTTTNVAMSANATAALFFDESFGVDASAGYSISVKNTAASYESSGNASAFTQDKMLYASLNTKGLLEADYKYSTDLEKLEQEASGYIDAIIGKIGGDASIEDIQGSFDTAVAKAKEEALAVLANYGYSEEDIKAYAESGYLKVSEKLDAEIEKFIKENEVKITETTKDSITFSANVAADDNTKVACSVTLSTKTLLPLAATADISAAVPAIVKEIVEAQLGTSLGSISGMLDANTQNCKGTVSVKIQYSAKKTNHTTDGYTEVTLDDIMDMINSKKEQ